jgi:hypothetical protein
MELESWRANMAVQRRGGLLVAAALLGSFPAVCSSRALAAGIASVSDLGISAIDVPISTETKLVYLVNPALNRATELDALLRETSPRSPAPEGWTAGSFSTEEITALTAAGRPGETAAYGAISDVVEQFFKFTFTQVPFTERSLHQLVQEVNRSEFPLAAVDASPRVLQKPNGGARMVETQVSLRLFMVHLEADRDRNLRWVSRCELSFEDSAVGRSPLIAGSSVSSAVAASVLDAFRGKIAVSFTHTPALRRPSGKIDEPRRDLIDRSISASAAAPAEDGRPPAAAEPGAAPATRRASIGGKP